MQLYVCLPFLYGSLMCNFLWPSNLFQTNIFNTHCCMMRSPPSSVQILLLFGCWTGRSTQWNRTTLFSRKSAGPGQIGRETLWNCLAGFHKRCLQVLCAHQVSISKLPNMLEISLQEGFLLSIQCLLIFWIYVYVSLNKVKFTNSLLIFLNFLFLQTLAVNTNKQTGLKTST